ncbi:hypothetical protein ACFQ48_17815 [Hymenobacter caeli]|uniref:STAS/SEC14 domain-containing protein n=1 Tax=Hymenobacter caeli TaxID=2735894 RepID=A0ABX2FUS2_9BACT|nr:hypothetical protein [Hymenobacter caeli]NRT20935.1 hypothetical protein [Hymenobacter caeli]
MNPQLLQETPNVSIYLDCTNQWLFVDWRGDLTLTLVQDSCLAVARHFLHSPHTRVLNSNTGVTSMDHNVPAWLAKEFLPYLRLAGIKHVAWVYSPNLRVKCYTDAALYTLDAPVVNLFDDLESACAWLRGAQNFPDEPAPAMSSAVPNELGQRVGLFSAVLGYRDAARQRLAPPGRGPG